MQLVKTSRHLSNFLRFTSKPSFLVTTRAMAASSQQTNPKAQEILDYWLGEGWQTAPASDTRPEHAKKWFGGGPVVDAEIISKFGEDCEALIRGDLDEWHKGGNIYDTLAGILIGDQFCRNVYRNTAKMYAADPRVMSWAKDLVESGKYKDLLPIQRQWIILPFMHSENLADQEMCVRLAEEMRDETQALDDADKLKGMMSFFVQYAERHRVIVEKYGRFPHRNALVGRENTPEEAKGLEDGSIEGF